MPAALATVRAGTATPVVKLAVEFVVLTGCRSGEARHARWSEIDGDTWQIDGSRTKTGKPHAVPLSTRALEVLAEARTFGDGDLVFPAPRTGKPLSDNTLSKTLRTAGIPPPSMEAGQLFGTGWLPRAWPSSWPRLSSGTSRRGSPRVTGATI